MKCALVGSRFFAASVFEALRKEEGIEFTSVVAPAEDDRLAIAAPRRRHRRACPGKSRASCRKRRSPKAPT